MALPAQIHSPTSPTPLSTQLLPTGYLHVFSLTEVSFWINFSLSAFIQPCSAPNMQVGYQRCHIKSQTHICGALQVSMLGCNHQRHYRAYPCNGQAAGIYICWRAQVALECTKDNTREAHLQVTDTSGTANVIKHLVRNHRVCLPWKKKRKKRKRLAKKKKVRWGSWDCQEQCEISLH